MSAAPFALEPITSRVANPVVEVTEEAAGRIVFCWRASGTRVAPRVWREGSYTIRLFDPDGTFELIRRGVKARS
jgi:hypothetical protein